MSGVKRDPLNVLTDDWRSRTAVKAANWILRTFAPDYAKFIAGAIEYGMCAAAADVEAGRPIPDDWRSADLLEGEAS